MKIVDKRIIRNGIFEKLPLQLTDVETILHYIYTGKLPEKINDIIDESIIHAVIMVYESIKRI